MSRHDHSLSVPISHAGPITDFQLEQIITAGQLLQNNLQPSDSDLALILITAPQIATELLRRRRATEVFIDMNEPGNVTFLRCP